MAGPTPESAKPIPSLEPANVKVFLADDSSTKRDAMTASLGEFGLGHSLIVATDFDEAREFIEAQEPNRLAANVFLLDGDLDPKGRSKLWQGRELAGLLFQKYYSPAGDVITRARNDLGALGASSSEISNVIDTRAVRAFALRLLHKEALIIGVSRDRGGSLGDVAQYPLYPYKEVGKIIFDSVVPKSLRKQIEAERRRREQIAQGDEIRAKRAEQRKARVEVGEDQ